MYASLLLPFSPPSTATPSELLYRTHNLTRTRGTIFLLPPPPSTLTAAFTQPPRPRSRMSAGATALCKHFERSGSSSEHGRPHPFWPLPVGSNEDKNRIALGVLEEMLRDGVWRNVMLLHRGVAVYEVRNGRGWGMRWTLEVEWKAEGDEEGEGEWRITRTTFRGFVEPIEGLDHELGVAGTE